jgi:hypothetical protein
MRIEISPEPGEDADKAQRAVYTGVTVFALATQRSGMDNQRTHQWYFHGRGSARTTLLGLIRELEIGVLDDTVSNAPPEG